MDGENIRKIVVNRCDQDKVEKKQDTSILRFDGFYLSYDYFESGIEGKTLFFHRILQFFNNGRVRSLYVPDMSKDIWDFVLMNFSKYLNQKIKDKADLEKAIGLHFTSYWVFNLQNQIFTKHGIEDDCYANEGNYYIQDHCLVVSSYSNRDFSNSLIGEVKNECLDLIEMDYGNTDQQDRFFEFIPFPTDTILNIVKKYRIKDTRRFSDYYPFISPNPDEQDSEKTEIGIGEIKKNGIYYCEINHRDPRFRFFNFDQSDKYNLALRFQKQQVIQTVLTSKQIENSEKIGKEFCIDRYWKEGWLESGIIAGKYSFKKHSGILEMFLNKKELPILGHIGRVTENNEIKAIEVSWRFGSDVDVGKYHYKYKQFSLKV